MCAVCIYYLLKGTQIYDGYEFRFNILIEMNDRVCNIKVMFLELIYEHFP